MVDFKKFISEDGVVLMPGAMGTELQRRGYDTKLPLWSAGANLDAPHLVTQIHKDYLDAGADMCVTNTFRTTPRTYAKLSHPENARKSLKAAVDCAKAARDTVSDRKILIAGSYATLEDCYEPSLVPSDDALLSEHREQVGWLLEEGVDFLLPETINSLREAIVMARVASESGLQYMISFVVGADGALLDGTPLEKAVAETDRTGRVAVAVNCRPVDVLTGAFSVLSACCDGVKGVYANGIGKPDDDLGWIFEENADSIGKYVTAAGQWRQMGATIIGGCCGTTPAYIRALSHSLR